MNNILHIPLQSLEFMPSDQITTLGWDDEHQWHASFSQPDAMITDDKFETLVVKPSVRELGLFAIVGLQNDQRGDEIYPQFVNGERIPVQTIASERGDRRMKSRPRTSFSTRTPVALISLDSLDRFANPYDEEANYPIHKPLDVVFGDSVKYSTMERLYSGDILAPLRKGDTIFRIGSRAIGLDVSLSVSSLSANVSIQPGTIQFK